MRACLKVINFLLPNTLKHYIHRVGRTARAGKTGRSISLVGENERLLLKDILKTCKVPAKMRIVPQGKLFDSIVHRSSTCICKEIVQIFRNKLEEFEPDVEEILKMEEGEKMLKSCETQVMPNQSPKGTSTMNVFDLARSSRDSIEAGQERVAGSETRMVSESHGPRQGAGHSTSGHVQWSEEEVLQRRTRTHSQGEVHAENSNIPSTVTQTIRCVVSLGR